MAVFCGRTLVTAHIVSWCTYPATWSECVRRRHQVISILRNLEIDRHLHTSTKRSHFLVSLSFTDWLKTLQLHRYRLTIRPFESCFAGWSFWRSRYMYYSLFLCFVTTLVTVIVSWCTKPLPECEYVSDQLVSQYRGSLCISYLVPNLEILRYWPRIAKTKQRGR